MNFWLQLKFIFHLFPGFPGTTWNLVIVFVSPNIKLPKWLQNICETKCPLNKFKKRSTLT